MDAPLTRTDETRTRRFSTSFASSSHTYATTTFFDVLPLEIVCKILSSVNSKDVWCALPLVCQKWNKYMQNEKVWLFMCQEMFGAKQADCKQQSFYKQLWKENATLSWSPKRKALGLLLSNQNCTVTDTYEDLNKDWRTILADLPNQDYDEDTHAEKGKRYHEMRVDKCDTNNTIKIVFGVTDDRSHTVHNMLEHNNCHVCFAYHSNFNNSWSYWANGKVKEISEAKTSGSVGEKYSVGDCIGVLLDYDEQTLAFFKNGKQQGKAFSIRGCGALQLVVSLINGNEVTLNRKPQFRPNPHAQATTARVMPATAPQM